MTKTGKETDQKTQELADLYRRRAANWDRFEEWQRSNPNDLTPQVALAGVGFLFDLLPLESRTRPVDTAGIQSMREAISVLGRSAP